MRFPIHVETLRVTGGKTEPGSIRLTTARENFLRKRVFILQQEAEKQIHDLDSTNQNVDIQKRGNREASDIFHSFFLGRLATDAIISLATGSLGAVLLAHSNLLFGILSIVVGATNEIAGLIRAGEFKNAANTHWRRSQTPSLPHQ